MPVGIERAQRRCGRGIGRQAKKQDRRWTPLRPVHRLAVGSDEPRKPAHRARRLGFFIITGAGKHGNWDQRRDVAPVLPAMEFGNSVGAHQPDEAVLWVSVGERPERVDGVAGACLAFEVRHADRCPLRYFLRGDEARLERSHVRALLERVAGRHQPPQFVEAERLDRRQAELAVPLVRGVERSAEKSDARHYRGC